MGDELEGVLENIDWSGMGRVINRTNVIELAPDSSYLFLVRIDESTHAENGVGVAHDLRAILRSLLGETCKFEVVAVSGDTSLDVYRFQEATE